MLAAGGGSRFAGASPKLLADFRGRALVTWVVDAAVAAGLDDTLVVTGAVDVEGALASALASAHVACVHNDRWAGGLATSLHAGWTAAADRGHDAVVVGLGDQPLVPAEAWRRVAASTSPLAVATFSGERRPPVRLARQLWPLLPVEGDEGARVLMGERPELVAEVACPGEAADIDTMEDLERWS